MATTIWQELKNSFERSLKYCENTNHETDCSLIQLACQKAGKAFFEMLSGGENPFGLDDKFKQAPIAENVPPNGKSREHYAEYWLCVLGFLARAGKIIAANNKLANTKVPSSWAAIDYDSKIVRQFFIDQRDYIGEVCNASIQICNKILEPPAFKPPEGYLTSKEIPVPRTTLQGWQEKDGIDIKKINGKNYYPKEWVEKRMSTYKAKPKKSVT